MERKDKTNMTRREFLRRLGIGTGSTMALMALEPLKVLADEKSPKVVENRMTYRVQHGSGEQISLLGFGMMRLPNDQNEVNRLVDYAIEHGVNYFDTAPMYMGGQSEVLTGNALSRYPRDKYFVATKMSNQNRRLWSFEASKQMYEQSFERLKVDHIDYYLLHSIGGGMDSLKGHWNSCSKSVRQDASNTSVFRTTVMCATSTGCWTARTSTTGILCKYR